MSFDSSVLLSINRYIYRTRNTSVSFDFSFLNFLNNLSINSSINSSINPFINSFINSSISPSADSFAGLIFNIFVYSSLIDSVLRFLHVRIHVPGVQSRWLVLGNKYRDRRRFKQR